LSTDREATGATAPVPGLPPAPATAVHRRSLIIDSYPVHDEHVTVVGRLTDVEPWDDPGHQVVHDMTLRVTVRLADLVITAAEAGMGSFPHAECPFIAPSFGQLEGLSVRRGFTRELRQRLGGVSGCAHLGELARAMGPAVVRTSAAVRRQQAAAGPAAAGPAAAGLTAADHALLPVGSCHVWAPDGPGLQKVAAGWVPGEVPFPVPPLSHFTG
jgi:hypothetical protein